MAVVGFGSEINQFKAVKLHYLLRSHSLHHHTSQQCNWKVKNEIKKMMKQWTL